MNKRGAQLDYWHECNGYCVNGLHCHPLSADLPPGSFELVRMPITVEVERVDRERQKVSPIGRHDLLIWFRLRTGVSSQVAL